MLTFTQLRKFDTTPTDKSLVNHTDQLIDCGDWWSNNPIAFHEPKPAALEAIHEATYTTERFAETILNPCLANDQQLWPVRIQHVMDRGTLRTMTRLDSQAGPSVWVNTKYLLASAKRKRGGATFWMSSIHHHTPIVCKNADGDIVSLIMPLTITDRNTPSPDWSQQDLTLPAAC